jgi:lincosamide nucleotidyltransferase A/C/D/E
MVALGIDKLFPWPGDRPWNWVLHDGQSRRVDLHLYEWESATRWHYGSAMSGDSFPAAALAGSGVLDGLPVSCETPTWALQFRSGYPPRDVDRHDIRVLCERFELDPPQD